MTKPVILTKEQEAELVRRYKLGVRCISWLDQHGQVPMAREVGSNQCTISKVVAGGGSRTLTDEQIRYVRWKGRHAKKVREIQIRNSLRNLRTEYHTTTERIYKLAGTAAPIKIREKRMSAVERFLTMALSNSPVAVAGYY